MPMKVITAALFFSLPVPIHAIEFNRCVDSEGVAHFTNVAPEKLDKNCKQPSFYQLQLENDYLQIDQNILAMQRQPEVTEETPELELSDVSVDESSNTINQLFDPDKALEQLLENTQESEPNAATKMFRARSDAVEKIMDN